VHAAPAAERFARGFLIRGRAKPVQDVVVREPEIERASALELLLPATRPQAHALIIERLQLASDGGGPGTDPLRVGYCVHQQRAGRRRLEEVTAIHGKRVRPTPPCLSSHSGPRWR